MKTPPSHLPVRLRRTLASMVAAACLFGLGAVAQPTDQQSLIEQARERFAAADFAASYALYVELFRQAPGNENVNFELGRAAFEAGDYEAAVLAFERVLMINLDHDRARLELARTYFQMGVLPMARAYFEEVLAKNPPEAVKRNIDLFLKQIEARGRQHFLAGTFELGVNWDTNARVSPETTSIPVPGFGAFTVEDEESDVFYSATLGLAYTYRPPGQRLGLKLTGLTYHTLYTQETDLEVNYLNAGLGPTWQGERSAVDVQVVGELMDKDYDRFLKAYGAQVNWMMGIHANVMLTAALQLSDRTYYQTPERDALNAQFLLGPTCSWGRNLVTLRVGVEDEDTSGGDDYEEDQYSYVNLFCYLRYERRLPWDSSGYVSYRFEHIDYDADYAVFDEARTDRINEVTVGLSKLLHQNISVELIHTYTRADSSLRLYDYNRNLTSLLLSVSF